MELKQAILIYVWVLLKVQEDPVIQPHVMLIGQHVLPKQTRMNYGKKIHLIWERDLIVHLLKYKIMDKIMLG